MNIFRCVVGATLVALGLATGAGAQTQTAPVPQCQYQPSGVQGGTPSSCGNLQGFIGSDGKVHQVSSTDPLPTAASSGGTVNQGTPNAGGTASWWTRLVDNLGSAITSTLNGGKQSLDVNVSGSALPANAAQETGGNLATIATNTTGGATAVRQDTGNASLSTIATNTTGASTSAKQDTGNTSLSSIDTKLSSQATAANQTTGNTSLSSIDTKLTSQATAANQTTANGSLSTIATNTTGSSTAANQSAIQAPVAPATATATKSVLGGCQYNSAGITPTDGQQFALQCGPKGGLSVGGSVASAATDNGNPVKTGAVYNSSVPTVTTGQRVDTQADAHGDTKIVPADANGVPIDPTQPAPIYAAPCATNACGISRVASTAVESGHVIKASAGNLYDLQVTTGAGAGNVMVFNSTTVPGDGAVTPVICAPVAANSMIDIGAGGDPPGYFTTGISVAFSTAAGSAACLTKTASSTAFFSWKSQ